MFAQIDHHRPLHNGYSGYFPSGYGMYQADMDQNFPSGRLLCMMSGMGGNTLVLDAPTWRSGALCSRATPSGALMPRI